MPFFQMAYFFFLGLFKPHVDAAGILSFSSVLEVFQVYFSVNYFLN